MWKLLTAMGCAESPLPPSRGGMPRPAMLLAGAGGLLLL